MPYMLLVMEPAGQREARPVPDGQVLYDRMVQFGENLKARGHRQVLRLARSDLERHRASRCATASAAWSTVPLPRRRRSSAASSCSIARREQALAAATECPAAEYATIEVREVGPCWDDS